MTLVAMLANMKNIILLLATLSTVHGDPAAATASTTATESTSKADAKSANSIPVQQQKQATFYTPMLHRPPYIQYVQRPMLLPQPQATMLIIAQPAVMPQQMIYSQAAQQLLNYFHSNPQARYQFLHGNYQPHPTVQTYVPQYTQNYQTSPSLGNYQIVAAPHQNQHVTTHAAHAYSAQPTHAVYAAQPHSAQPTQLAYSAQNQIPVSFTQHQQPTSLSHISNLANLAAQQYQSPIKTAPPIITGFENFTPEQQAQIKQQLSSHFGSELSQISGNSVQAQTKYNFDAPQATSAEDSKESPTEFTYRNMFSKG